MILNPGECILCRNAEEGEELRALLKEDGYKCCNNSPLTDPGTILGVRWYPADTFPSCATIVSREIFQCLADNCMIDDPEFCDDGHVYDVRWFKSVFAEVGDLL